MSKTVFLRFAGFFFLLSSSSLALGTSHPATIGQGPDSVAMHLHFPPKEKAAKTQGAVKFYCEVSSLRHGSLYSGHSGWENRPP
jgi:hypothetical protein